MADGSTQHQATRLIPYRCMLNQQVHTTVDTIPEEGILFDRIVNSRDAKKRKMADARNSKAHIRSHCCEIGDLVLCKQMKQNK